MCRTAVAAVSFLIVLCCVGLCPAGEFYNEPPINYSTAPTDDPISRLQRRLDNGSTELAWNEGLGYLKALLHELKIPASSQTLVFSKTSAQRHKIWPSAPRALYFNDDVYIGYVKDSEVLEISSVDPRLGAIFYILLPNPGKKPRFERQTHSCLQCHDSTGLTLGVPGHMVRSVYPDSDGMPMLNLGTFRTNFQSPLKERWGGWYVTGQHGKERHLGNLVFPGEPDLKVLMEVGANRNDLSEFFDASSYLTNSSDIAALMVLEYQAYTHNLITRASYETRIAYLQNKEINKALERPADYVSESTQIRLKAVCDPVLNALLFKDEARFSDSIKGNTTFAADFASRGPRDSKGRSLRELDLEHRMFKYPCSYLIYSESFDALPTEARDYILQRLWQVLNGQDTSKAFDYITPAERDAIREILIETKPSLPDYWRAKQ
ncbi:MAG TPA: hypothetical protein VEK08_16480 [Planctomycetota bacterium]|nr:hypothetical protein [Planctomycetota bacterium]